MNRAWRIIGRIARPFLHPLIALYLAQGERARAIVVSEEMVLVVKPWLNSGKWDLPGGGIEEDETALAATVRELQEELGLIVDESAVSVYLREEFRAGLIKYPAYYTYVTLPEKIDEFMLQKHEIVEARWVTNEELDSLPMISGAMNKHAQAVLRL